MQMKGKIKCENIRCSRLCGSFCSSCRVVFYCSPKCQKEDREKHAPTCNAILAIIQLVRYIQQEHREADIFPSFEEFQVLPNKINPKISTLTLRQFRSKNLDKESTQNQTSKRRSTKSPNFSKEIKSKDYLEVLVKEKKMSSNLARRFIATQNQNVLHALFLSTIETFLRDKKLTVLKQVDETFHFMAVRGQWVESHSCLEIEDQNQNLDNLNRQNENEKAIFILIKRQKQKDVAEDLLVEFAHRFFPIESMCSKEISLDFAEFLARFPNFPSAVLSGSETCLEAPCFLTTNSEIYLLNLAADRFWTPFRQKKKECYRFERVFFRRDPTTTNVNSPFLLVNIRDQPLMELTSLDHLGGVMKDLCDQEVSLYLKLLDKICSVRIISLTKENSQTKNFILPLNFNKDVESHTICSNEINEEKTKKADSKLNQKQFEKRDSDQNLSAIEQKQRKKQKNYKKKMKNPHTHTQGTEQIQAKCEKQTRLTKTTSQWKESKKCRQEDLLFKGGSIKEKEVDEWATVHLHRLLRAKDSLLNFAS